MASLHLTPSASRTSSSLLKSFFNSSSPSSSTTALFSSLALPSSSRSFPSSSPSSSSNAVTGLALGSLLRGLWEMFPAILRAVPKTRTSHSKKRKRATHKQLKDNLAIVACRACGRPKLHANICQHCKSAIVRDLKNEKRVHALIEDAKARGEDPFEIWREREEAKEAAKREEAGEGHVAVAQGTTEEVPGRS